MTARVRAQDGSVLVLAIGAMTIFGFLCAGILGIASVGSNTSRVLRHQQDLRAAADGAIEAALNRMRSEPSLGESGTVSCMSLALNGASVAATCSADPVAVGDTTRVVHVQAAVDGTPAARADARITLSGGAVEVLSWRVLT